MNSHAVGGQIDEENRGSISRHRINVSSLEQLQANTSFRDFISWRSKGNDFYTLEHLNEYPSTEQVAALRLVLSTGMLHVRWHYAVVRRLPVQTSYYFTTNKECSRSVDIQRVPNPSAVVVAGVIVHQVAAGH